jgi:hypothetical protein
MFFQSLVVQSPLSLWNVLRASPPFTDYKLLQAGPADRYQTGAAALLKAQRDAAIEERDRKYERARDRNMDKEEARWQNQMQHHAQAEAREQRLADGSAGSSNHSSVSYDPITLEYYPTMQGQKQKYEDDLQRYKQGVRTETLHRRGAGSGINPITGQELAPPAIPGKPRDVGGFNPSGGFGGGGGDHRDNGFPPSSHSSGSRNNIW